MRKFFIVCVFFSAVNIVGMQDMAAQQQDVQPEDVQQQEQPQPQQSIELSNLSPDGEEMYQKSLQALKSALSENDYADALSMAKKMLIFDPNRADVCYKIGEIALLIGDITSDIKYRNEAVHYFEKAVQIDAAYSDMVDIQYDLMNFDGELAQPVPENVGSQPSKNDFIMLMSGKITPNDLITIKENQPALYDEYFLRKAKYKRLRNAGWISAGVGAGLCAISFCYNLSMLYTGYFNYGSMIALGMAANIGAVGVLVGVPLIVVGAVKMNRTDIYIADEYNRIMRADNYRTEATFSLGTTSNGLGFLVKF